MRTHLSMSRLAILGLGALLFLGLAAGTPFSQSTFEDRVFTAHGGNQNLISRVDPILDSYIGSTDVGATLVDMFPHTSKINPVWIVAASQGNGLYRISTNQGLIDKIVNTQGTVKAAQYVNSSPLQPHYVAAEDYNGTTSSAMIEFMDVDAAKVSETFVTGSTADKFTDVCFTHTDVGADGNPTNDYYRWWFTNFAPINLSTDSLWVLDFNYNDTLQGDPTDPFNTNPIIPGPPFPKILTQLDANFNKWYEVVQLASNEDARMVCESWVNTTAVGTAGNYVVIARTHIHPGPTPFYEVHISTVFADAANPITAPVQETTVGGGGTPVFKTMKIFGNYALVTHGSNPTGSGGTNIDFFYLPELADGTGDGDDGNRGSVLLQGCDGVGVDVDQNKVYVGCDESNNLVWMLNVEPTTQVAGTGLINDIGALPVLTPPKTITMLLQQELNQVNPPNRIYPGRSTLSFRIVTDPVLTFPGQGTGGRRTKGACSGTHSYGSLSGLAAIALLLGVAVVMARR